MPAWSLRDDVRLNSYRACRELLVHLPTPAERDALRELNNIELARQGYEQLGACAVTLGEVLQRFRHLNADYRDLSTLHESCQGQIAQAEQERDEQKGLYHQLEAEHNGLQWRFDACAEREKELFDKVKDFDKERDVWLAKNAEQAERINQLEAELAASRSQVERANAEKADMTANLAQSDIVRQNLVKCLIPLVFRRLSDSQEYKQALAKPFSLAYTAGWINGVGVGRTSEEAEGVFASSRKVNREAPQIWKAEFEKLFTLEFPYIKKIADSHRLPLGDLMNIFPDSATPQGLLGQSSQAPPVDPAATVAPETSQPAS